jgi:hypothetical protein
MPNFREQNPGLAFLLKEKNCILGKHKTDENRKEKEKF